MQVEIWSDVVCPWCAVGRARFARALAGFAHRDEVTVRWRSFELDPDAPTEREGDYASLLAGKYRTSLDEAQRMIDTMTATAAADGLEFRFERARPGNSFDAHRLLHLAGDRDRQDALKERLFRAYLTEGEPIGRADVLARLATEVGLDADEVGDVLAGDAYADAVRGDERQALAYGIRGVPFFVIDGRYGISGAQPTEVLTQALAQAHAESRPLTMVTPRAPDHEHGHPHAGAACADGGCAV